MNFQTKKFLKIEDRILNYESRTINLNFKILIEILEIKNLIRLPWFLIKFKLVYFQIIMQVIFFVLKDYLKLHQFKLRRCIVPSITTNTSLSAVVLRVQYFHQYWWYVLHHSKYIRTCCLVFYLILKKRLQIFISFI